MNFPSFFDFDSSNSSFLLVKNLGYGSVLLYFSIVWARNTKCFFFSLSLTFLMVMAHLLSGERDSDSLPAVFSGPWMVSSTLGFQISSSVRFVLFAFFAESDIRILPDPFLSRDSGGLSIAMSRFQRLLTTLSSTHFWLRYSTNFFSLSHRSWKLLELLLLPTFLVLLMRPIFGSSALSQTFSFTTFNSPPSTRWPHLRDTIVLGVRIT